MSLEDDWADVRPPRRPKPTIIRPDAFQKEGVSPGGIIVECDDPENFGIPVRTELTVLPADEPREPLGFMMHELTDADIAERDSPENLERLRRLREDQQPQLRRDLRNAMPDANEPTSTVWTTLPVLTELWGRPWNVAAANFLRALRPSSIRIVRHLQGFTTDSVLWRVTVLLATDDVLVSSIVQEVEVAGTGFRNGQDASNHYRNQEHQLMQPQATAFINPRGVRRLTLDSGESPRRQRQRRGDDQQFARADSAITQAREELGPDASDAAVSARAAELYEVAELAAIRDADV